MYTYVYHPVPSFKCPSRPSRQAAMLRSEGLLKELGVHFFVVHALVRVHLPQQGALHHLRRLARLAIQVEPRGDLKTKKKTYGGGWGFLGKHLVYARH